MAGVVIGMDPGVSGAIAVLDGETGALLRIFDTPTFVTEKKVKGRVKRTTHINVHGLRDILKDHATADVVAVIEYSQARPDDGKQSAWQTGFGAGCLHGAVGMAGMQLRVIHPRTWKGQFGLDADKEKSRMMAVRRWPDQSNFFARKMDQNRAEAALLALAHIETAADWTPDIAVQPEPEKELF